ncbi:HrpB1 family type III secretion system apparatus protein [Paraburkholderia youngii]|uniref:HrpB1 family type III secretion system apparatus protein n=1 Tax=Paraburkholderia youngii TaxID=2782701 RepID=A0A7Y6N536_9BURK|nr:HrpB1 family type III secretion system apparatus protein [Paraburkholderia youngii]NUY06046.1 HrpB1 family type III secretion system apparatus protein [Paraburkholderia youngii]
MNASKPEYLNCSAEIVGGLIETLCVALFEKFPRPSADREDVGLVLDALHVLRPDVPEVDALDGILQIVNGNWDDAIHILHQVVARAPGFLYAKSLLAFSLAAKGDPHWRQCAGEVIESDAAGGDADKLMRALIARDDLMAAQRAGQLNGKFVMPDSVAAMIDMARAPADARGTPNSAGSGQKAGAAAEGAPYQGFIGA